MMHRYPASLPVLAGVLGLLFARPAAAESSTCSRLGIEIAPDLSARWPELPGQLREAFRARDDVDQCARSELTLRDASIGIEVVLPDGRSATRTVSRPEDVMPTLESLLLVPQRAARDQPSPLEPSSALLPPASARSAPARGLPRRVTVLERAASEPSMMPQASRLRIELSVVTGGRVGDGQAGVGLGAFSFLELSEWLIGFEGRVDRYRTLAEAAPGSVGPARQSDGGALELALLGGRRFRFGDLALDLTAGPAAVMQGTATFEARSMTGENITKSSSSTVPRLLLGARTSFNALSTVRPFVGIDAELGPSRANTDVPGAARLPIWTLGLALGATVGTK